MDGPTPIIIRTAQTEVARLLNLKKKKEKDSKLEPLGRWGKTWEEVRGGVRGK